MSGEKTILDMTDDELLQGCRRTAERTTFWHNDYYRELERRTQHRLTKAIVWLTFAIAVLTLVATITTFISALN